LAVFQAQQQITQHLMVAPAGCFRKPDFAAVFLTALELWKVRNHLPSQFTSDFIKNFRKTIATFTLLAEDLFMT
jgi:hypothetical protein